MWICRSLLFVPGHLEVLIGKASRSDADCVALDLQDGVPQDRKTEARLRIRQALDSGVLRHKRVLVRLNHSTTGLTQADLDGVACAALDGFVYPMAGTAQEITDLHASLSRLEKTLGLNDGHFTVLVLIETPMGVLNAYAMATASDRVHGLLFGAEDYLSELHGQHDRENLTLHTPRALIAIAARAAGIEAIDTPYVLVHDLEGLEAHARRARALGMSGMLVLSPRQIPIAHAIYTPSADELAEAREIVRLSELTQKSGKSYSIENGRLISPSKEKAAQHTLARFTAIQSLMSRSPNGPKVG